MKPLHESLAAWVADQGGKTRVCPGSRRACPLGICAGEGMIFTHRDGYRIGSPCPCSAGARQRQIMTRLGFPRALWQASLEPGYGRDPCRIEGPNSRKQALRRLQHRCLATRNQLHRWIQDRETPVQGLLLDGPPQSGKSFWMGAIVGDLIRLGLRRAAFLSGPRLLSAIAHAISQKSSELAYLDRLIDVPILMVDDARPASPREADRWRVKLEQILLGRLQQCRPTLITMPWYPSGPPGVFGQELWVRLEPSTPRFTLPR